MSILKYSCLSAVLTAILLSGFHAAAENPDAVFPQPAYRADQFVDFIGLSASPFERYLDSGPFKGAGTKYPPELFFDLGVRHYRTGLKNDLTPADAPAKVRAAYEKYGARPMLLIDPGKDGAPQDVVNLLKEYGGSKVVGEVEGPNEVNNKFPPQELNLKYGGKHDEAAGAAYMADYYKALKVDPATKDIPVICYTAIFTDYRLARPCDAFDYNNMHSYQGYDVPSSSLLSNFVRANHILPVGSVIKPFVPTECGYNIQEDVANHIKGNGNASAQALNIPMLLGEYFLHGFIKRAYLFALTNADGYGLLESDQATRRPSYYALQSLIAELRDSVWNSKAGKWVGGQFRPRALLFTVENAPKTFKCVTLQKENGEYTLLLWNEGRNWDATAKREIDNEPVNVTLRFATAVENSVKLLRQDGSGAFKAEAEASVDHGKLNLDVPSSVILVEIRRQKLPKPAKMPRPEQFTGEASDTLVSLKWKAPAKGAHPFCYFVYRNGWCIGSTTETSFQDRSPWIRPGLGYTYQIQSCDASGNMSKRVTSIVQTPAKFPELAVTDLGMEKTDVKPGESVRFRARIKNIGEGSTPFDVNVSASFSVDGEFVSWGGVSGPLAPGEERESVANGGPKGTPFWNATQGAHLLKVQLDDLDRLPEESNKVGNFRDQTFVITGSSQGELLGESEAAPWEVDLTSEGREDWVHWGLNDAAAVDRKAGANRIGSLIKLGQGYMGSTGGFAVRSEWSDGVPTNLMKATNSSVWVNGVGSGFAFTVPAGKTKQILKVYAGGIEGAACSLSATLSDHSALPYVSKTWTGNSGNGSWAPVPGDFATVYTIRYRAASEAQTLKVEFTLDAEANRFLGQARIGAATLASAPLK